MEEEKTRTIVFAGGGTGGHLFPALAVADELQRRHPKAAISFIGARRGLEQKLVPQAGYPLLSLALSGIKGRGLWSKLTAAMAAGWAVARCLGHLWKRRPDLVIGVGGYASGPAMLAATILKTKTMVLEQNHFPGATNRWLAPRVDAVCLPSEAARRRLDGVGVVTGNPVRPEFLEIGAPPAGDRPSLLVFGGSRGAHSVNLAVSAALSRLAALEPAPRIVHQTGTADEAEVRRVYADYPSGLAEVHPFLDDMPARLAAADLVICRAGASTLSELAAAGRASILVPYPHAADDHQRHNAETLQQAGAAEILLDGDLSAESVAAVVGRLVSDREGLARMSRAARSLALPDATARIADIAEMLMTGDPMGASVVS